MSPAAASSYSLVRRSTFFPCSFGPAGAPSPSVIKSTSSVTDLRTVTFESSHLTSSGYVLAGSVGLPYEGDGDARWAWIEDGVPELRRTAYDAATAGRCMRDACPALADSLNASLIEPVEAMVVTRMFEDRAGAG